MILLFFITIINAIIANIIPKNRPKSVNNEAIDAIIINNIPPYILFFFLFEAIKVFEITIIIIPDIEPIIAGNKAFILILNDKKKETKIPLL